MSLHRLIAPPPLAIAVHPAPPPKTREEVKKEDDKRRADRVVKAEADKVAEEAKKGDEKVKGSGENDQADKHEANKKDDNPDKSTKAEPGDNPVRTDPESKEDPVKLTKPLAPLQLLPPVPHRPLRSRLDLNPSQPYPPIDTDPRGAYYKYAKAVGNETLYIDLTKDGWLTEQWRERGEREALARLTGEANRQQIREMGKLIRDVGGRKLPDSAEGIIMELWNDLVDAKSNELSVDTFWARYDWSDPEAKKHKQLMPADEKAKAKAAEILRVKKEVEAEAAARLAARAAREAEKKLEEEAKEQKKAEKKKEGDNVDNLPAEVKQEHEDVKKDNNGEGKPETCEGDVPVLEKVLPGIPAYHYPLETAWTREGIEDILATVGIQCAYNTEKPLPRHWSTPAGAYLLLAHGHFLLRVETDIQFKPEGPSEKFEILVTSTEDRVFGDLAKGQLAAEKRRKEREYRHRMEKEYKEKKEKERLQKEAKGDEDGKGDEAAELEPKVVVKEAQENGEAEKKAETKVEIGKKIEEEADPKAVISNAKAADEEIKKDENDEDKAGRADIKEKPTQIAAEKAIQEGNDNQKKEKEAEAAKREARHKEAAAKEPMRDVELLLKMLGPDAAEIPIAELQLMLAAIEADAAGKKAQANAVGEKKDGPIIWAWHETCERWRWENFRAGCAVIEVGGWEERDWKAFADEKGMDGFEAEMSFEEETELDIHDWAC